MNPALLNGLALAYIGDAYYELLIREKLLNDGLTQVNLLHKKAILYTSGSNQAAYVLKMIEEGFLTEEEIEIFKKGRNCHTNQNRKNIDIQVYQKATGFEAIIGFLYLNNRLDRINEIMMFIGKCEE